jgi:RNA 2',3'-cyclic 3'-phosphodiesterase
VASLTDRAIDGQAPPVTSRGAPRQRSLELGVGIGGRPPRRPQRSVVRREGGGNIFFAIYPDPATAEQMVSIGEAVCDRYALPGSLRPAKVLHVSLVRVGWASDLPTDAITLAVRVGDMIRAAAFSVTFDRVVTFGGTINFPIVLRGRDGIDAVKRLRWSLDSAMKAVGLNAPIPSAFTPHVTLIYSREPAPDMALAVPVTWTARELVLVCSRFGETRHDHIDRWPLRENT